jgi:hypothetical protein
MAVRGQHCHFVPLADTHLPQGIGQAIDTGRECTVGITPIAIDDGHFVGKQTGGAAEKIHWQQGFKHHADPFKLLCMHSLHFLSSPLVGLTR